MSKEVVIQSWCDGEHERPVRATIERTESLGQPIALDLCESCAALFEKDLDTVRAWLARGVPAEKASPPVPKVGRPRAGVGGRPKPDMSALVWRTCPDCGYECPTRTALGQHTKTKHDKVLSDYTWPAST